MSGCVFHAWRRLIWRLSAPYLRSRSLIAHNSFLHGCRQLQKRPGAAARLQIVTKSWRRSCKATHAWQAASGCCFSQSLGRTSYCSSCVVSFPGDMLQIPIPPWLMASAQWSSPARFVGIIGCAVAWLSHHCTATRIDSGRPWTLLAQPRDATVAYCSLYIATPTRGAKPHWLWSRGVLLASSLRNTVRTSRVQSRVAVARRSFALSFGSQLRCWAPWKRICTIFHCNLQFASDTAHPA